MRQGLRLEPLLQAISDFLDDQKDMIEQVRCDLTGGLKKAETGRSGLPSIPSCHRQFDASSTGYRGGIRPSVHRQPAALSNSADQGSRCTDSSSESGSNRNVDRRAIESPQPMRWTTLRPVVGSKATGMRVDRSSGPNGQSLIFAFDGREHPAAGAGSGIRWSRAACRTCHLRLRDSDSSRASS
jgi:hypothetical protein